MPNLPIRNLGQIGVIKDVDAYDLPPTALSAARNVRFANGAIKPAHVWRSALATTGVPRFVDTYLNITNNDVVAVGTSNGRVWHVSNYAENDRSIAGYVNNSVDTPYTACTMQGLHYVNRSDRVPWYYNAGGSIYTVLTNWDANHRAGVFRSFKQFLIALDITKSGTRTPNMVKWSDIALYGAVPGSWDPTDTTKSAGENTIGDMKSPILDGLALRNSFVIYAANQIFIMDYTGGNDVFVFDKVTDEKGILNTNCVVEVDGVHFVFGFDDIFAFDGASTPRSIIAGRNKEFVFRNLDRTKQTYSHAYHSKDTSEVWFCFNDVSGEGSTPSSVAYCNTAAAYNYVDDTWTFFDLPNVTSICRADLSVTLTYTASTDTYSTIGGSYSDLERGSIKYGVAASVTSGTAPADDRLMAIDTLNQLSLSSVADVDPTPFAQRIGLDLDETGEELRAYKIARAIYPQAQRFGTTAPITFKFGSSLFPGGDVTWGDEMDFDPSTDYKVDTMLGGRYLAWYMRSLTDDGFKLSGFDLDVVAPSRR